MKKKKTFCRRVKGRVLENSRSKCPLDRLKWISCRMSTKNQIQNYKCPWFSGEKASSWS